MKRLSLYLSLMLALFVVACGNDSKPTQATQPAQQNQLFPAGKAVATKDHGANHPPSFNSSTAGQELTLLLPRGPVARLEFGGEPATDPDGDAISYRFAFAVPGLSGIQTPAEALFKITREGNNFVFQGNGDITPAQFTSVYGEVATIPTLPSAIYASDGTDESDPMQFNVHPVYDGSAQFSAPAEYIGDQRWEIPTPIEMYEGATIPESGLPTWTAVTAAHREWGFAWSPPSIRCEIVTIFNEYMLPDGGDDNALFSLDSEERATAGTVSLAFKTAPDYETPGDSNADNEYQIRVVNTHDIHLLNNEGTPTGCSGSVLDVTIRVKDVGSPVPPEDIAAGFQDTDDTKIDVNWTASEGFSENGSLVEFPAGFEVTDYDYRYRAAGAAAWTEVTDTDLTATTVTLEDLTEDAYEIQVRANNSEGSGAWSSTIRAEQEPIPVIERIRIISTPESGTTYGRGEIIKVAVIFDMPVAVTGAPFLVFEIDSNPLWEIADYKSGSGTERLVFEYCVSRNDRDRTGISVEPNQVVHYKGSTITAVSSGVDANIDHAGLPDDPNHKINGCLRDE